MYVRAAINNLARMLFIFVRFKTKCQIKENYHYQRRFKKNHKATSTKTIVAIDSAVWRTAIIAYCSERI
jgi:hypothetical protein